MNIRVVVLTGGGYCSVRKACCIYTSLNHFLLFTLEKTVTSLQLNFNLQSLGRSLGETYFLLIMDLDRKGND